MMAAKDWTGQKFGRLTAVRNTFEKDVRGAYIWEFQCTCGNIRAATPDRMRNLSDPSCGCGDILSQLKHGKSRSKEFAIWTAMKQRCINPNNKNYHNYGGRGITVCDRWLSSFENFIEDMGEKPYGLSLERVDNSQGYFPENCKWDTSLNQSFNQRRRATNKSGKTGVHSPRDGFWQARIMVRGKIVILYYGKSKEEAILARETAELLRFGKLRGN